MHYRIILNCSNPKDEDKYGRDLNMNNFDAARATFKNLIDACYEGLIDPYTIEWWAQNKLFFKVEKK